MRKKKVLSIPVSCGVVEQSKISINYSLVWALQELLFWLIERKSGAPRRSFCAFCLSFEMKGQGSYVPPSYIPIDQSDEETQDVMVNGNQASSESIDQQQWSSGICACCDDMQSCCVGLFCPCYLFAKNAEFLGSGTFAGSCLTHFTLWGLVNTVCCLMTDGLLLGLPGCFIACYACNYRRALRSKYNLPEAPCGDFTTHFFCHLCAVCQEHREICERSGDSNLSIVTAPPTQKMEPATGK